MEEVLLRVTKHKHYKRVCNQPIEADISNKSPGQIQDFSSSLCNEIIYGQRRHNTGVIFISCTKPYIGSSQCDRDFFISLSITSAACSIGHWWNAVGILLFIYTDMRWLFSWAVNSQISVSGIDISGWWSVLWGKGHLFRGRWTLLANWCYINSMSTCTCCITSYLLEMSTSYTLSNVCYIYKIYVFFVHYICILLQLMSITSICLLLTNMSIASNSPTRFPSANVWCSIFLSSFSCYIWNECVVQHFLNNDFFWSFHCFKSNIHYIISILFTCR